MCGLEQQNSSDFGGYEKKNGKVDMKDMPLPAYLSKDYLIPLLFFQSYLIEREENGLLGASFLHQQISYKCQNFTNKPDLRSIINAISDRHLLLRSLIVQNDGAYFFKIDMSPDLYNVININAEDAGGDEQEIRRRLCQVASRPFDLRSEPPVRAVCIQLSQNEYIVNLIVHHAVSDGRSQEIISRDLHDLLLNAGSWSSCNAESGIAFSEYVRETLSELGSKRDLEARKFWTQKLKDRTSQSVLDIQNAPIKKGEADFLQEHFESGRDVIEKLRGLSKRGFTMNLLFLAANVFALREITKSNYLVIQCVSSGRLDNRINNMVGCMIEMVPLAVDTSDVITYLDLISTVRKSYVDCLANIPVAFSSFLSEINFSDGNTPVLNWIEIPSSEPASNENGPDGISVEKYVPDRAVDSCDFRGDQGHYIAAFDSGDAFRGTVNRPDWWDPKTTPMLIEKIDFFFRNVVENPGGAISPVPEPQ